MYFKNKLYGDGGAGQAIPSTPDPNDVNFQQQYSNGNYINQQQPVTSDFWSTYGVYAVGIGAGILGYFLFFNKKK